MRKYLIGAQTSDVSGDLFQLNFCIEAEKLTQKKIEEIQGIAATLITQTFFEEVFPEKTVPFITCIQELCYE